MTVIELENLLRQAPCVDDVIIQYDNTAKRLDVEQVIHKPEIGLVILSGVEPKDIPNG